MKQFKRIPVVFLFICFSAQAIAQGKAADQEDNKVIDTTEAALMNYKKAREFHKSSMLDSAFYYYGLASKLSYDQRKVFRYNYHYGVCCYELKFYDKVFEALKNTPIEVYNDSIIRLRAFTFWCTEEYSLCEQEFKELSLATFNKRLKQEANYYRGLCFFETEDFENTIRFLNKFKAKNIEQERNKYYCLAMSYKGIGNRKKCCKLLEKVLEMSSDDPDYYALILVRIKDNCGLND